MPPRTPHVQSLLFPADVLEGTLRIGAVGPAGHAQVLWQLMVPSDGQLIAMESIPALQYAALPQRAHQSLAGLPMAIEANLLPF